eukprot:365632-Chlamydomonas_euryale.AAC.20
MFASIACSRGLVTAWRHGGAAAVLPFRWGCAMRGVGEGEVESVEWWRGGERRVVWVRAGRRPSSSGGRVAWEDGPAAPCCGKRKASARREKSTISGDNEQAKGQGPMNSKKGRDP